MLHALRTLLLWTALIYSAPFSLMGLLLAASNSAQAIMLQDSDQGPPQVHCFCTEDYCTKHQCQGTFCLIGFTRKAKIVKACSPPIPGNRPYVPSCFKDFGLWTEICLCADKHCNRFSFFRDKFQNYKVASPGSFGGANMSTKSSQLLLQHLNQYATSASESTTSLSGGSPGDGRRDANGSLIFGSTKSLPVLLVVVPLAIGAVAVLLVMLNYYCKQC